MWPGLQYFQWVVQCLFGVANIVLLNTAVGSGVTMTKQAGLLHQCCSQMCSRWSTIVLLYCAQKHGIRSIAVQRWWYISTWWIITETSIDVPDWFLFSKTYLIFFLHIQERNKTMKHVDTATLVLPIKKLYYTYAVTHAGPYMLWKTNVMFPHHVR